MGSDKEKLKLEQPTGFREEAIPLIMWDQQSQKFEVNEDAK